MNTIFFFFLIYPGTNEERPDARQTVSEPQPEIEWSHLWWVRDDSHPAGSPERRHQARTDRHRSYSVPCGSHKQRIPRPKRFYHVDRVTAWSSSRVRFRWTQLKCVDFVWKTVPMRPILRWGRAEQCSSFLLILSPWPAILPSLWTTKQNKIIIN